MPIYEYRCERCSHEFETFIKRRDSQPDQCPECGEEEVKRLISNTSFQLKGSGWYETDYARDDGEDEDDTTPEQSGEGGDESSDEETEAGEAETTGAEASPT